MGEKPEACIEGKQDTKDMDDGIRPQFVAAVRSRCWWRGGQWRILGSNSSDKIAKLNNPVAWLRISNLAPAYCNQSKGPYILASWPCLKHSSISISPDPELIVFPHLVLFVVIVLPVHTGRRKLFCLQSCTSILFGRYHEQNNGSRSPDDDGQYIHPATPYS
jgi:hypothetical protein